MGFSWVGCLIKVAMFAPRLLLFPFPPVDAGASLPAPVPRRVTALEGIGRATCLVIPLISTSFLRPVDGWFVLAANCSAGYLGIWGRYLTRGRREALLLRPWAGIPVPLAVFPVLTFSIAAGWGRSPALAGATAILAAGHVTGSWISSRAGRH